MQSFIVFIKDSLSDGWPTVLAALPVACMVSLIVISNQPLHGCYVTADFSVTDEPSSVCQCVWCKGCREWMGAGDLEVDRTVKIILL